MTINTTGAQTVTYVISANIDFPKLILKNTTIQTNNNDPTNDHCIDNPSTSSKLLLTLPSVSSENTVSFKPNTCSVQYPSLPLG